MIQWDIVKKLEKNSKRSIIAGDDDQAIYKWNGADADSFINLEGEKVILQQSYRVPQKIFNVANNIIKKVKNRVEKNWVPKEDLGEVKYHWEIDRVDLSQGEWLILARTNLFLEKIAYYLDQNDFYFQRRNSTPRVKNIYSLIENWNKLREGIPLHYNDYKKITNKMSKNVDLKSMKHMSKEDFYDMDTLKEKYGLKTDEEWYIAFDDLGDHEISKIQKLIKNGEDLSKDPRIKISTIHGVKGNERDNVVLITDLSNAAYYKYLDNPIKASLMSAVTPNRGKLGVGRYEIVFSYRKKFKGMDLFSKDGIKTQSIFNILRSMGYKKISPQETEDSISFEYESASQGKKRRKEIEEAQEEGEELVSEEVKETIEPFIPLITIDKIEELTNSTIDFNIANPTFLGSKFSNLAGKKERKESSSERKDKKVNTEDISTMSRIKSAYISLTRMVERFE